MSTLRGLNDLGQNIWLDDLRRDLLMDGSFAALIDRDGVSGLTSNSAIFARALDESTLYDADIDESSRAGDDAAQTYERLIVDDIRRAADMLEPTCDTSEALDGYVSLEVSPHHAHDTQATAAQLAALDVDLEEVAQQLEREGVSKFVEPFDRLLARIEAARARSAESDMD